MGEGASDRPVFAAERHARILALVTQNGRARTTELAEILDVAEPTIRKDIIELAGRGLLVRTYGGAMAAPTGGPIEPSIAARSTRQVEAKGRMARAAAAMISDRESVYLDNGTSVLALAAHLAQAPRAARPDGINVLTNGVQVAQLLADVPGIRHVLIGGTYRTAGNAVTGPLALESLARFSVSTAFIGVSGLADGTFTVADLSEAQVKSAAIARASRVVVLMDSDKFGVRDFAAVCEMSQVHAIVTDSAAPSDLDLGDRVEVISA